MREDYTNRSYAATLPTEIGIETGRVVIIGTRPISSPMLGFCLIARCDSPRLWVTCFWDGRKPHLHELLVTSVQVDNSSVEIRAVAPFLFIGDPLFYYQKKQMRAERARSMHVARRTGVIGRFEREDGSVGACVCVGQKECRAKAERTPGGLRIQPALDFEA